MRLLVRPEQQQTVLDALQSALGGDSRAKTMILPLEAVLPRPPEPEESESDRQAQTRRSRESLYTEVESGARLDSYFLLMVLFSTIVATIGLLEDNVAVVIGAMVIAPLLGPNLALALATALGDRDLMWRSLRSNLVGLFLAIGLAFLIALLWAVNVESRELLSRTDVGLDSVALALTSGAVRRAGRGDGRGRAAAAGGHAGPDARRGRLYRGAGGGTVAGGQRGLRQPRRQAGVPLSRASSRAPGWRSARRASRWRCTSASGWWRW